MKAMCSVQRQGSFTHRHSVIPQGDYFLCSTDVRTSEPQPLQAINKKQNISEHYINLCRTHVHKSLQQKPQNSSQTARQSYSMHGLL